MAGIRVPAIGRLPGERLLVGIAACLVYLAVAVAVVLIGHSIAGDAWSRVGNAYYVLFSRDPHLSAVGFVWNPLPSLAVLPLLPFKAIWPDLVATGFAGSIVSAVCMAGAAWQVHAIAAEAGLARPPRMAVTLLFACNPMIVYYGANGMSEAMFLLALLTAVRWLARWGQAATTGSLVLASLAVAIGYLARYEALAAAAGGTAVVALLAYRRADGARRHRVGMAVADGMVFAAPTAIVFVAWALASWLIVGDPFEQFTSIYGNTSQMLVSGGAIAAATGQGTGRAFGFLAYQLVGLAPGLVPLLLLAIGAALCGRLGLVLAALGFLGGVAAFSTLAFLDGRTQGWLRFLIVLIPLAAVLAIAVLAPPGPDRDGRSVSRWSVGARASRAARLVALGALAVGIPMAALTMLDPAANPPDGGEAFQLRPLLLGAASTGYSSTGWFLPQGQYDVGHEVAGYIDSLGLPGGSVLVDAAMGFPIIMESGRPDQFVTTTDRDFPQALADPRAFGIRYLLVPVDAGYQSLDALNRAYPGIYWTGAGIGRFVREFDAGRDDWRVYAVVGSVAATNPAEVTSAQEGWPMYLHDLQRSGASGDRTLTVDRAPDLRPLWTARTGGPIVAAATVVGGTAYVGSWDGYEYAFDAVTGRQRWKTFLGTTQVSGCDPPAAGVSSTATVSGSTVYVGGGDAYWYALDAQSGAVLWRVFIGDNSAAGGTYNWSSPLVVGDRAYVGVASLGDCPLVQGKLLEVDLTTHQVVATARMVPDGQHGGTIWTTPALDTQTNMLYVTTGNENRPDQPFAQAIVALDATTLAVKGSWRVPVADGRIDSDFGTSPLLFEAGGRTLAAATNKNGVLYAFDAAHVAAGPVWSRRVAIGGHCPECGDGSVSSAAIGGGLLFVAGGNTTVDGRGYPGGLRALDPASGAVVWERGLTDVVLPALAYDNGMVLAGVGPRLEIFDARNGTRIFSTEVGELVYGPPTVSDGIVYVGSTSGSLRALTAQAPMAPPEDPSCPAGWTCQPIGDAQAAGRVTAGGNAWSIVAGGSGLAPTSGEDDVHLVARTVSGDVGLSARIDQLGSAGGEAGLVVRQSADPAAPSYAASYVAGQGLVVRYRTSFGGPVTTVRAPPASLPLHLEVARTGDRFVAATSTDGTSWVLVPGTDASVVMPATVLAGLEAAAGREGSTASAAIDGLAIGPPAAAGPAPSAGCPDGWRCTDVGDPLLAGRQAVAGTAWTLGGAGTGIGDYADQLHFDWQALASDGTITAHVGDAPGAVPTTRTGVMVRADPSDPGAPFYAVLVTPKGDVEVSARMAEGLRIVRLATARGAAPAWVRIARWQGDVTAYTSTDGASWAPVGGSTVELGAGGGVAAGLAATSGAAGTVGSGVVDHVSVAAGAPPSPTLCPGGWSCRDIGFPLPGTQTLSGDRWTIQSAGTDIWDPSDSFRFLSRPMTGDGVASVRVVSQQETDPFARAGLMLRAGDDPAAPYYGVFVTPEHGVNVQWRRRAGDTTALDRVAGTVPIWLRLVRSGREFSTYTSLDGAHWSLVVGSTVELDLPRSLAAGVAVASHEEANASTVVFTSLTVGGRR